MADEIRLPVSADTTQMERNIADAARRVGTINLNANIDSRGIESLVRPLGKITGQADEFSKSMEAANARVLAFGASVGVINALNNAFKGLVSSTVEVEKSLTEIKIIGNETFSNLNKTSAGLFATAKQLGVSYKDAADATLEFARQGKGLTESLNASKAALALTRTAGISATEAVMGLTSAVNAFGRGADAYIEYANKMSAVSDAFAVNNKDLIEGLSRSASVAQEAGVSFEQVTALITTLQEKTGRGGAVIGNALKTIFTRVQNPEIIKDLRDLGISVQDATTGAFLPATQIIQNLANEFQAFDKNLRNNILLKVGGGFQVDKLAALLNDVKDASGTYQRSLNIATSGSGDILGRVAKLNQTIDSSFTNILTSSKQLGSNIGQIAFSKDFVNILQNGASLISSINDAIFGDSKDAEDQGSAIGKAVLKGLGSVISGPGLFALLGIFTKLSIDFAKFSTEGVKTLIGITSKSKEEQLIQAAISKTLSENTRFQNQILSLEGNRVAQAELLLGVIRQQVNESKKLEDISKNAASALYGRGVRLSGGNPQIVGSATNSAKGYIPNLADAIAKEKSESPAGSRIIVDRNFPMGGGERSTMVYNSNETRIKNFAGTGGDAIIPNYPINSAKGFVPNFAKKEKKVAQNDGRKSLEVDAANLSVAGLTFAGENKGFIKRAKPVPIDEDLLAKYSGSPYVKVLEQFKNFTLTNVPVGNVYRLRKGLQQSEDEIKADFLQKLNSKFREQTISFLLEEINGLGLPTGGGVGKNLSNLKLNVIGSSTAGYIFEEILKIPTLSDAEKVAQYASQSDTDFFDIKNLSPEFSEAYGLPKRGYDLVELKFGERELKDGISKKFLNQLVAEGGGANPKKFGQKDTNRAARGYIPNFADENFGIEKTMSQLKNIDSKDKADPFDLFKGKIKLIRQQYSNKEYYERANNIVSSIYPKKGRNKLEFDENMLIGYKSFFEREKANPTYIKTWETTLRNKDAGYGEYISSTKGMLGELDAKALIKKQLVGGNNPFDFANYIDARTRKEDSAENLLKKGVNFWLRNKNYAGNGITDEVQIPKMTAIVASDTKFTNAAKGYIPNFSELTGTGAGMLYQDVNFKELGGGQSGKFLAPKSGEGFGQKIFYKTGSDKINQEYQVNKSIKDFEKQNPALFTKNAISFTNVGKLLTKNGLAAGFEREVVGGLGVDEFATGTFSKGGAISPKTNFAFYLSELLAQSGVKNVVGEYRKIYGPDSLRIDDIYAQNFKVNDIMQKMLIEETNQFFKGKKKVTDSDVNNYIGTLNGNPLINSLNEKFGAAGGRHTMFDTQGFAKNASKGYIPNFANVNADILTVNPAVAKMSVDQFIEKYLGSQYSTGLSGTSANALKITGSPQQMMEAKRDFIMSMLGPNFLATYERNEKANNSRAALIRQKSKSTGTRVKKQGGFMRAYGDYAQTDLSAALEGTFSGNAKKLNYEDLDTKAEKIFQQNNLTQHWNEIVKTMQLVGEAYRSESVSANNAGRKMDFDYSRIEVPEEGKFKYGLQQTYKAKEKIRELTALIRPKLIEGLLEGEKGVQGLVLNQPEYDKEGGVEGDYLVLLDAKAAQLKKLVSDYLINPDLDPLQIGSPEQSENKFRIREIIDALDGPFGSGSAGKGIFLDELKQFRNYSKGNPQLQKFFMDGEDKPGAFLVQKASQGGRLGAFLKPDLPQSIIEKIATVLAASYNRDGIFQLSNLDVGYAGQLSYAGSKNNPLLDTFATSPQSATSIPSTVKYGDYKNNKAYYDSIAKWKYDPTSKSMVRQAAKGYIPNFAKDALEDAVVREQVQSGLPNSQISFTRDSRLANNLNPSGFAVINKRDEPNGKVPANRIADAYKNAGKGFIPNFTERAEVVLNRAAGLGAAGTEEAKKIVQANINSGKKVSEAQIKLTDEILKYIKSLNLTDEAQNKISKFLDVFGRGINRSGVLNEAQINALSIRGGLSSDQSKALRNVGGISPTSGPAGSMPAGNAPAVNQPPQSSNAQQEESKKKATKSLGDLAQTAFIFQSGLSFATGALSTFGKEAEALGDVLNSIGQIGYTVIQGSDLFKQISKGKGLGESIKGAYRGAVDLVAPKRDGVAASGVSALRALGPEGRAARAAELGITGTAVGRNAALGGRLSGVVAGAGGGLAVAGIAAGIAAGGYLLYKSVDSIGKFMNGAASRTERAVNAFNDIQEKYNVQLSDKQRVTVDRLSELADVSGTSLSGAAAGSGYTFSQVFRSLKASLGFKDETYKNPIQQQIAKSGLNLDAEGNQALAKSLGPLLAPIVTEATNKRGENGLIITAPQAEQDRLISKLFSEKLKEIDTILKEELKKPQVFSEEEIQKIIKDKNLKETIEKRAPSFEEMKKMTIGEQMSLQDTGGFIYEKKSAKDKAKEVLEERRISDVTQIAAARVAQRTAPESIAAQATLEAQKQGILIQTELLKKRLEITQQIAKIESTIPSALESSLSIQKELLSTNEASKFASDLQLKNLQEERQVRAEIKELFSNEARDIITKNLDRTSQLGVKASTAEQVTGLFNNLQAAQSIEDQKKAYSEIVNQLDLSVSRQLIKIELLKGENEELETANDANAEFIKINNEQINQLSEVNKQLQQRTTLLQGSLDVINKQSQARRIQAAQAAQERAITEKSNYYYTLQKDIFSAQIEIQNKKLEKAKQELDIRKQMRDLAFEEMQFADKTKTEPRKQYEAGMFAAQTKEADTINEVRMRNAEKNQAYRQSLYNDISSRTNNLGIMSDASKAAVSGNTKELERLYAEAFKEQAQTFDQKVLTAANQFAQIIVQSAKDSEAIKRGEQPSTSYEAISSGKSIKNVLESKYQDYQTKADVSKDLESLKAFYKELNYADPQGNIVPRIAELEKILKETSQDAADVGLRAKKPVTENEDEIAEREARIRKLAQDRLTRAESERTTFSGGFQSARDQINLEIETFNSRLGKDIPMSFRDSMVSAMKELSNPNSTQPLKERLLGVANAFLQKINEAFMTQAANKITSSIMGSPTGMASGGYIKGGSGLKDDVPAMLMGGEYVVTKSAVQKYGPSFFDALNKGTIKKYASGGWVESDVTKYQDPTKINPYGQNRDKGLSFNESGQVIGMDSYSGKAENKQDAMMKAQTNYYAQNAQTGQGGFYMPGQNGMGGIMGARNLLAFATQQTTGTKFDKISSRGGAASIDIGAGSSNLSLFALRDQDNIRNQEYLQAKQKSSELYFGSLDAAKEKANKEEEIRKEQERLKQEQKTAFRKMYQGLIRQAAQSVLMAGIGQGMGSMGAGMSAAKQAAWQSGTSAGFMEGALSGGTINGETRGGLFNMFNSRGNMDFSNMVDTSGNFYKWNRANKTYSWQDSNAYNRAFPYSANYGSSPNSNGYYFPQRRASGGFVAGNGMGDNVPTMLNGGEFVVSRQAAQNIGANKLQQINSGNTGNDSSEIIAAKLDELVEKLSAVGTINITVNSDGKGGNQSREDESQNTDKQQKELARRIKDVVLGVLRDEKRLGGLLR